MEKTHKSISLNKTRGCNFSCWKDDFLISYYGVRHWGERWGPWGTPNEIVRKMQEYIEAGAQHLIVRFASWDQREQFDRFAKEVLPHFK